MSYRVTVKDFGVGGFLRQIKLRLNPQGAAPLARKIAQIETKSTQESFNRQADPETGQPWKPRKSVRKTKRGLSRGRVVRRRVKSRKTLVKTAALKRSSRGIGRVAKGRIYVDAVSISYGQFHQEGTRHIPQRRFHGFTPQAENDVERAILDFYS